MQKRLFTRYALPIIGLIILMTGCVPLIDRVFGSDDKPLILSMHLPDIPDENISIDQVSKVITITVPTSFSHDAVTPDFILTQRTKLVNKYPGPLYIYTTVKNDSIRISTASNKMNAYIIAFKPIGDLMFATLTEPLNFTVNASTTNYLCLPLFNFLDGDPLGTLTLTNIKTGISLYTTKQRPTILSLCDRQLRTDGAVFASALIGGGFFYEPGDYTAVFTKANGRKAVLNQPVRLIRGQPYIGIDDNFPVVLGAGPTTIFAQNIFQSDNPELMLRSRDQSATTIKISSYIDTQPTFKIPAINNLKPGYYYAQAVLNGQPSDAYMRISIVASSKDLAIQNVYGYASPEEYKLLAPTISFDTPIKLKRSKQYGIITNAYVSYLYTLKPNETAVSRVRLTSLTKEQVSYVVPLAPTGPAQFELPSTIPSDRYKFSFEVLKPDNTVISSEPLERDVVIE